VVVANFRLLFVEYYFVPICITTIKLFLCRTLVRFVILIIAFDVHNYYQLLVRSIKPTPSRFNGGVFHFAPPGRGWLHLQLVSSPLALKTSRFIKHLRKARGCADAFLPGGAGVGFINPTEMLQSMLTLAKCSMKF
jgi:hypothetical protein